MEFQQVSIALLASMVLVLAGMVGWLYWQQQRLFQNMNNIIAIVGELARPPLPEPLSEPVEEEVAPTTEEVAPAPVREDEDDRVSVEETPADVVTGPPAPAPLDTDNLEDKTKKELQDILTKRGIPFGKGDNKGALISLLKATA
jgi:hypothetical protein